MMVILRGTGQLNGPVGIYKELDLDDDIARRIHGQGKEEILKGIMDTHYPGVKYNPNQIGINVLPNKKKPTESKTNDFVKGAVVGAVVGSAVSSRPIKTSVSQKDKNGFRKEIEHLLDINFSETKPELVTQLENIFITLKAYKWPLRSDNSERDVNNTRIMNQVYEKYKIGYKRLVKMTNETSELEEYKKQFKKLRIKKIFNQHGLWIYTLSVILFLILLAVIYS